MRSDNLRAAQSWLTPELVGRVLALAMPVGGEAVPVQQMPTRGVKPSLTIVPPAKIPPAEHARRAEEDEAAIVAPHAVSPQGRSETGKHLNGYATRKKAAADKLIEDNRRLFQIAFDRGIATVDLSHALGWPVASTQLRLRKAGLVFGKRPPLADRLTIDVLLALGDPEVPLPELRGVRLERERLEREARLREQRRAHQKMRIREVQKGAACRPARPSASREPAPRSPARAQPYDSDHRGAAIRRSIERRAAAFVDGDESVKTSGGRLNQAVRSAVNLIIERRAAEDRLGDPVEQAKTVLRRRNYAPVCSMAVYDGDPDLFKVGHRSNLTREELLAMAARVAA